MNARHPPFAVMVRERDSQVNGNKVERAIKNRKGGTLFFSSFVCLLLQGILVFEFLLSIGHINYIFIYRIEGN